MEEMKEHTKKLKEKKVKDRTQSEHLFLIKYAYGGSVRNYLLSMGAFKEDTSQKARNRK